MVSGLPGPKFDGPEVLESNDVVSVVAVVGGVKVSFSVVVSATVPPPEVAGLPVAGSAAAGVVSIAVVLVVVAVSVAPVSVDSVSVDSVAAVPPPGSSSPTGAPPLEPLSVVLSADTSLSPDV
ncbi:MAG TPA: hypothetical protein PLC22_07575 [Gordonia sp. (in: high G+C Gram-positive bacteria)]|nr:hypothetical protein [Gordonia sp. (in: high G+C Gram-positive bacteria)]